MKDKQYLVQVGRMGKWRKVTKLAYLKYERLAGFKATHDGEPSSDKFTLTSDAGVTIRGKVSEAKP